MCIFPDMNTRYHSRNLTRTIASAASVLPALLCACASVALAGPSPVSTYAGTDLWFSQMRKVPANIELLRELAQTNLVIGVPNDCVEVAGTINFPDGNPFPADNPPELQIYCRDQ